MRGIKQFKDLVSKEGDRMPLPGHRRSWLKAGYRQDLILKEGDAIEKYIKRINRNNHAPQ